MTDNATSAALRAILPLAIARADQLRVCANVAMLCANGDQFARQAVTAADAATHAVTAARLALEYADASL